MSRHLNKSRATPGKNPSTELFGPDHLRPQSRQTDAMRRTNRRSLDSHFPRPKARSPYGYVHAGAPHFKDMTRMADLRRRWQNHFTTEAADKGRRVDVVHASPGNHFSPFRPQPFAENSGQMLWPVFLLHDGHHIGSRRDEVRLQACAFKASHIWHPRPCT